MDERVVWDPSPGHVRCPECDGWGSWPCVKACEIGHECGCQTCKGSGEIPEPKEDDGED